MCTLYTTINSETNLYISHTQTIMAYSVEEEEGPKCSFSIYLAEGDALAKQGDFVKAINAYSIALDIQPDDKNCLVARLN